MLKMCKNVGKYVKNDQNRENTVFSRIILKTVDFTGLN